MLFALGQRERRALLSIFERGGFGGEGGEAGFFVFDALCVGERGGAFGVALFGGEAFAFGDEGVDAGFFVGSAAGAFFVGDALGFALFGLAAFAFFDEGFDAGFFVGGAAGALFIGEALDLLGSRGFALARLDEGLQARLFIGATAGALFVGESLDLSGGCLGALALFDERRQPGFFVGDATSAVFGGARALFFEGAALLDEVRQRTRVGLGLLPARRLEAGELFTLGLAAGGENLELGCRLLSQARDLLGSAGSVGFGVGASPLHLAEARLFDLALGLLLAQQRVSLVEQATSLGLDGLKPLLLVAQLFVFARVGLEGLLLGALPLFDDGAQARLFFGDLRPAGGGLSLELVVECGGLGAQGGGADFFFGAFGSEAGRFGAAAFDLALELFVLLSLGARLVDAGLFDAGFFDAAGRFVGFLGDERELFVGAAGVVGVGLGRGGAGGVANFGFALGLFGDEGELFFGGALGGDAGGFFGAAAGVGGAFGGFFVGAGLGREAGFFVGVVRGVLVQERVRLVVDAVAFERARTAGEKGRDRGDGVAAVDRRGGVGELVADGGAAGRGLFVVSLKPAERGVDEVVGLAEQVFGSCRRHDEARGLGGALEQVMVVDGDEQAIGQHGQGNAEVGGDLGDDAGRLDGQLKEAVAAGDEGVGRRANAFLPRADEQQRNALGLFALADLAAEVGRVVVDGEEVDDGASRDVVGGVSEDGRSSVGVANDDHVDRGLLEGLRERLEKRHPAGEQENSGAWQG